MDAMKGRPRCSNTLLYLIVMLASIISTALVSPPLVAPDETAHLFRATYVARLHFLPATIDHHVGAYVDTSYLAFSRDANLDQPGAKLDQRRLSDLRELRLSGKYVPVALDNTGLYPALTYLPQAAGIALASLLTDRVFYHVVIGRIANGISGLALVLLAIRLFPPAWPIFLAVTSFPLTLFLFGSLSQDVACIGLAAVFTSLLLRTTLSQRPSRDALAATLILICLALARPPYVALGVPLAAAYGVGTRWRELSKMAGAAILVLTCLGAQTLYLKSRATLPVSADADPGVQINFIREHPIYVVVALAMSSRLQAQWWIESAIGILGPLTIRLPKAAYLLFEAVWLAAMAAAGLSFYAHSKTLSTSPPPLQRTILVFGAALGFFGTLLIMLPVFLVTWTPPGQPVIFGMQGRYLIPPALVVTASMLFALFGMSSRRCIPLGCSAHHAILKGFCVGFIILTLASSVLVQVVLARHYYE